MGAMACQVDGPSDEPWGRGHVEEDAMKEEGPCADYLEDIPPRERERERGCVKSRRYGSWDCTALQSGLVWGWESLFLLGSLTPRHCCG